MAGGADLLHGWFLLKEVSIQKSPLNGIRSADVTLAATAMALKAVCIHSAPKLVADNGI
jgi:hypothetical protein